MAAKKWTDEQKTHALKIYAAKGPAAAERDTGIPRKTIASWARRAGIQTDDTGPRKAAIAAEMHWAERRARLADKAGRLAETMLDRAFDTTEPRNVKLLVESAQKAVEQAQLLTGAATARINHDVTDPAARLAVVHDLRTAAADRAQA